jgi:hypothetical protein
MEANHEEMKATIWASQEKMEAVINNILYKLDETIKKKWVKSILASVNQ